MRVGFEYWIKSCWLRIGYCDFCEYCVFSVLCVACCILSVVYGVFWSCSCSGSKTECPRFLDWAACVFLLLEWSSSVALLYTASFAFLSHCSHFLVGSLSPAFGLYWCSIVLRILTNLSWIFSRSWTFFTGHNLVHRCMKSQSRMDQWLSFSGKFTPFGLQSKIVNSVELIEKLSGTLWSFPELSSRDVKLKLSDKTKLNCAKTTRWQFIKWRKNIPNVWNFPDIWIW